jgi:hypothetical protein
MINFLSKEKNNNSTISLIDVITLSGVENFTQITFAHAGESVQLTVKKMSTNEILGSVSVVAH